VNQSSHLSSLTYTPLSGYFRSFFSFPLLFPFLSAFLANERGFVEMISYGQFVKKIEKII